MLDIEMHSVPLFMLTGISCFLMGAIYQQDVSFRAIVKLMQLDPYVYQRRQRIFTALKLFGSKNEEATNGSQIQRMNSTNLYIWLRNQIYNFFSFFLRPNEKDYPNNFQLSPQMGDIMKYGFPGLDNIHVYPDYVLSYDRRNRIAHWVCEHLCSSTFQASNAQNHYDKSLPDYDHYTAHICGPELKYLSENDMCNAELKGLRSIAWRSLEEYVHKVTESFGSVYVYSGPLYMPKRLDFQSWAVRYEVIDLNTVAVVPTHFFKVIIIESQCLRGLPYMEGYVIPNSNTDENVSLSSYLSDIRDIEHFSGLKFYDGLRRNQFYEVCEY